MKYLIVIALFALTQAVFWLMLPDTPVIDDATPAQTHAATPLIEPEQPEDTCQPQQVITVATQTRLEQITPLLENLPEHHKTTGRMALLAEMAGLQRKDGRALLPRNRRFEASGVHHMPADALPLSKQKAEEVSQLIEARDYQAIATLLEQSYIPARAYIGQYSVWNHIIQSNPQITVADATHMIEAGLQITRKDLIRATTQGASTDMLALLRENTKVRVGQLWYANSQYTTLATTAIGVLNVEAFEYWFSQGINVQLRGDDNDVWGHLPVPSNKQETQAAQAIFNTLVQYGYTDITQWNYNKLAQWLPESQLSTLTIQNPDWFDEPVAQFLAQADAINQQIEEEAATLRCSS